MINTNFNRANSINFTAKLDISEIKNNKALWNNVADIFENKTKKIPYDFSVSDENNKIDIFASADLGNEDYSEHCCTLTKSAAKDLLTYSQEKIAQKFIKLLNIFKHQDNTKIDTMEFLKKLAKNDKYDTLSTPRYDNGDSIYDRIFYPIFDKIKQDRINAVVDDPIFKDADFID